MDCGSDSSLNKCAVCNERASGTYYGVLSCGACKGFFKRTKQRQDKLRKCYLGGNCSITPDKRNNCKACRFNKFMRQRRALSLNPNGGSVVRNVIGASSPRLEFNFNMYLSFMSDKIYQTFLETSQRERDSHAQAIELVNKSKLDRQVSLVATAAAEEPGLNEIWTGLVELFKYSTRNCHQFVGQIPGLANKLNQNDLKSVILEGLILYITMKQIKSVIDGEWYLVLANGVQYSKSVMCRVNGPQMTEAAFDFAESFHSLELTERERALLLPLVLTMPKSTTENEAVLRDLNGLYFKALMYEFELNLRPKLDKNFFTKFEQMIEKLACMHHLHKKYVRNLVPII